MTVKIPRWFGVPPELIELGHFAKLSDGSKTLYVFLHWVSDRRSSRQFELKDADVVDMAGISKGTLSKARKQLLKRKMIVCDREPGGHYAYTLTDLATGQPYPGDPRAKIAYEKKSKPAEPTDETPAALTDVLPESMGDAHEGGLNFCDTSFPFGWNLVTPQPTVCDYNPFSDSKWDAIFA